MGRKSNKTGRSLWPWRSCLVVLASVWLVCLYAYTNIYHTAEVAVRALPSPTAVLYGSGALPGASGALRSLHGGAGAPAIDAEVNSMYEDQPPAAPTQPAAAPTQPPPAPAPPLIAAPSLPLEPALPQPASGSGVASPVQNKAAADAWEKLLASEIQVDYMRERMTTRRESWLDALPLLTPTWEPLRRTEGDGIVRALVWPHAAYQHFGVQRVWSLGEYAQWADLCASLATLGFEVHLWPWRGQKKEYPQQSDYDRMTAVFTDYDGVHGGWRFAVRPPPDKTWILDTFGTDGTVVQHGFFGRQPPLTNYPLGRFLTLVPGYAVRNSFLGVAVVGPAHHYGGGGTPKPRPRRKWQCVLWSKVQPWLMWKSEPWHKTILQEYTKHCHVIATIDKNDTYKTEALIRECCPEVEIRGVQTTEQFAELLRSSAVYVGVGEPLIAPSCFEALSLGTHVIQPRMPTPKVLKNKPITQVWTSQHPFLEKVPEPFAFTVDPESPSAIAEVFRKLKASFDSVTDLNADTDLARFYANGEYPLREVYSMAGFLGRVAQFARDTRPLDPSAWTWEREDHPDQLPRRAFEAGGGFRDP